jgi:hypothetical protein
VLIAASALADEAEVPQSGIDLGDNRSPAEFILPVESSEVNSIAEMSRE